MVRRECDVLCTAGAIRADRRSSGFPSLVTFIGIAIGVICLALLLGLMGAMAGTLGYQAFAKVVRSRTRPSSAELT